MSSAISVPNALTLTNPDLGARLCDWLRGQSKALETLCVSATEEEVRSPLHVELAGAGEAAAIGAKALLDGVRVEREGKGQSTSVTVARREIRKWLSESAEGRRAEQLVGRLLRG